MMDNIDVEEAEDQDFTIPIQSIVALDIHCYRSVWKSFGFRDAVVHTLAECYDGTDLGHRSPFDWAVMFVEGLYEQAASKNPTDRSTYENLGLADEAIDTLWSAFEDVIASQSAAYWVTMLYAAHSTLPIPMDVVPGDYGPVKTGAIYQHSVRGRKFDGANILPLTSSDFTLQNKLLLDFNINIDEHTRYDLLTIVNS